MSKQPSKPDKQAGQSSSQNRKEKLPQIILTAIPKQKPHENTKSRQDK